MTLPADSEELHLWRGGAAPASTFHAGTVLDSNDIIFRYNAKARAFSLIQADYLLQNDFEGNPVYLFLAKRNNDDTQVCRTFFPKSGTDYAEGQPRYTLLRKEKRNLENGDIIVQYDRADAKAAERSGRYARRI